MDCKICLVEIEESDSYPLSICNHMYHFECMRRHLLAGIDQSKCPITCPELGCKMEVAMADMMNLLNPDELKKY